MKKGRSCLACGRSLRKGSARRAMVVTRDGSIANGIVCKRCALRAVAFVVASPVTVPTLCKVCKRATADVCMGCHDRHEHHVKTLTKANVALRANGKRASRTVLIEGERIPVATEAIEDD